MKLYKYSKYSEHLLTNLIEQTIWLSAADKFNDIFDCKFKKTYLTIDQINEINAIQKYRNDIEITEKFKKELIYQDIKLDNLQSFINDRYESIEDFVSTFGIFSLSEIPDSLLLWAHYGDNHCGICIEYEVDNSNVYVLPVTYSTQYPILSIYQFNTDLLQTTNTILTTKSMEWAYEKEWRYIKTPSANKVLPCPFHITKIIFGARFNSEKINAIKTILKKYEVKYQQAKQSKYSFSIEFEDI